MERRKENPPVQEGHLYKCVTWIVRYQRSMVQNDFLVLLSQQLLLSVERECFYGDAFNGSIGLFWPYLHGKVCLCPVRFAASRFAVL